MSPRKKTISRCHHRPPGSSDLSFHSKDLSGREQHDNTANKETDTQKVSILSALTKAARQDFLLLLKECGDEESHSQKGIVKPHQPLKPPNAHSPSAATEKHWTPDETDTHRPREHEAASQAMLDKSQCVMTKLTKRELGDDHGNQEISTTTAAHLKPCQTPLPH
jgi:hypothetical protein